jgi:hypothetical protein
MLTVVFFGRYNYKWFLFASLNFSVCKKVEANVIILRAPAKIPLSKESSFGEIPRQSHELEAGSSRTWCKGNPRPGQALPQDNVCRAEDARLLRELKAPGVPWHLHASMSSLEPFPS